MRVRGIQWRAFSGLFIVVQAFLKIPALHALAPNGKEPPFVAAQVVVMAIFIGLEIVAAKRFRVQAAMG